MFLFDGPVLAILIWRIWRVEKQSERYFGTSGSTRYQHRYLRKAIRVIAESGAAYTLLVFITLICEVAESNALYPIGDIVSASAETNFIFTDLNSLQDAASNRDCLQCDFCPVIQEEG